MYTTLNYLGKKWVMGVAKFKHTPNQPAITSWMGPASVNYRHQDKVTDA